MVPKQIKAVTLIELIIVVIIAGVLAALTLPRFATMREKAFNNEARASLTLIAAAEEIYRLEQDTYTACQCGCRGTGVGCCNCCGGIPHTGCNTLLHLSLNPENWTYSVDGVTATTFTARASRQGSGGYLDCQYTFTETNYADGVKPVPNASCPK